MKYTPGPWYANMEPGLNAPVYIKRENGTFPIVDFVYGEEGDSNNNYENAKANAHLIAAAPELLEACKIALNTPCVTDSAIIISEGMDENCEHCNALRKAIAKAEGKE